MSSDPSSGNYLNGTFGKPVCYSGLAFAHCVYQKVVGYESYRYRVRDIVVFHVQRPSLLAHSCSLLLCPFCPDNEATNTVSLAPSLIL